MDESRRITFEQHSDRAGDEYKIAQSSELATIHLGNTQTIGTRKGTFGIQLWGEMHKCLAVLRFRFSFL